MEEGPGEAVPHGWWVPGQGPEILVQASSVGVSLLILPWPLDHWLFFFSGF